MAPTLLGPPEIRDLLPPATSSAADQPPADPFIDLMDAKFNAVPSRPPTMGLTENLSPTYISSGDPCLDFFFKVVPDTTAGTVAALLAAAWDHDALTALKLVAHLRGVRGTGKSDREGFYAAAMWLHGHHPKTLALNVGPFAQSGYIKDLLEILYRLITGPRVKDRGGRVSAAENTREERIADAGKVRRRRRAELACKAAQRYAHDTDYRFLHDRVAEFFAGLLSADLDHLRSGRRGREISLAAKWCPSIDSSFDRATLLCESIARRMFPRESDPAYEGIEEEHYAYRVRDRLRKEVLTPIRAVLELPEIYMSSGNWTSLPYTRVASVAMKNYKSIFMEHDEDRFLKYLADVKAGKSKIAAGALLPHEILKPAYAGNHDEVSELQWQRTLSDLLEQGKFRNCISICDVSGSMHKTPLEVSIALGLLVSELNEEPWKGRLITFSANPSLHKITGDTLAEKASFVKDMEWGMNTDFQKVFDRILAVAVDGGLPSEQMVKRVLVFSDMEFDEASANEWETDYQAIQRKFQNAGYGAVVPEIVFWNLRDSDSIPVKGDQKGVALVSGFSKNLLKLFLEGGGIVDPVAVMRAAISGKEYSDLLVFD